jgi:D-glycero-alpha-D-manno-heptose 1-phosphate guanylyltransferase
MLTEAIVLAGGYGKRLRSVVSEIPKPMAPVRGRPFLAFLLDYLAREGVRSVVLAVGYKWETIQAAFGSSYGPLRLQYSVETEPLGTGGGIRLALEQTVGDSVLALNGDTFFPAALGPLAHLHESTGADMTLALKRMERCERYGTLQLDSTGAGAGQGRITGFAEKGAVENGLINGGIYAVRRQMLVEWAPGQAFSIEKDVLEKLAPTRRFMGVVFDSYFIDIGIPEDYARAQEDLP